MQQHITIVEYNPEWPGIFKYESEKIRKILGDKLQSIDKRCDSYGREDDFVTSSEKSEKRTDEITHCSG